MNYNPQNLAIWSDEALLVVNKPAGLPALPDGYDPQAPFLKEVLEAAFGRLWIVQRIDRQTSGVLVLARTAEAHRSLNTQFEKQQVSKRYHALVAGIPPWVERTMRAPLRADVGHKHRTVVDPKAGRPAITHLQVLEGFRCRTAARREKSAGPPAQASFALIEARPETGRTHQIRVHLYALGYPIVADDLYGQSQGVYLSEMKPGYRSGKSAESSLLGRLGLHARSLELAHPESGERMLFEAPYPPDLESVLQQLRKHCRTEIPHR